VKLILGGTSKERTFIYYELPGSPGNSHFYLNEYSTIDGLLRGKVETPMKFSNFNELKKLLTLNPFGLRLTKMQAVYLAQQKLRELEKKSGRGESALCWMKLQVFAQKRTIIFCSISLGSCCFGL